MSFVSYLTPSPMTKVNVRERERERERERDLLRGTLVETSVFLHTSADIFTAIVPGLSFVVHSALVNAATYKTHA